MSNPRILVDEIRSVLEEVGTSLLEENVQDATELLEHGEWRVALSLICAQLYEYNVAISQETYDQIECLGQEMEMPFNEWSMLQSLVV